MKEKKKDVKTRADIYKELDKKYEDTAQLILKKWSEFRARVIDYDKDAKEVIESIEENSEKPELSVDDSGSITEDSVEEAAESMAQGLNDTEKLQDVFIAICLESTDYEGGTLLDFFTQDYKEVSSGNGIRKLYPMVDALSAGQIAGLELVSLEDLFSMALSGEAGYEDYEGKIPNAVSVYEGVNREIYDQGGVALTNDTLRSSHATDDSADNIYKPKDMSMVLIASWSVTALTTGALIFSVVKAVKAGKTIAKDTGVAGQVVKPEVVPQVVPSSGIPEVLTAYHFSADDWNNIDYLTDLMEDAKGVDEDAVAAFSQRINELKGAEKASQVADKDLFAGAIWPMAFPFICRLLPKKKK